MEDRLLDLETKVAFQEDTIQKLSETVARQEHLLYRLCKDLDLMRTALRAMGASQLPDFEDEERPPHY